MTREEFLNNYWAYYLMLEDRFVHTLNYVELSQDNEDVYSNEYAALIQMIGAEIDSFFKVCCGFNASDIKNITDYYHSITTNYPGILTQEVSVRAANMTFKPFDGWNGTQAKQSLFWWLAFDNDFSCWISVHKPFIHRVHYRAFQLVMKIHCGLLFMLQGVIIDDLLVRIAVEITKLQIRCQFYKPRMCHKIFIQSHFSDSTFFIDIYPLPIIITETVCTFNIAEHSPSFPR